MQMGDMIFYEDGTRSNFTFDDYKDACFAWLYPDLTEHVLYTARVVEHTVRTEEADGARMLATFQRAKVRLKEVLEMLSQDANRVIRSVKENGWRVSGKLRREYPILENELTAQRSKRPYNPHPWHGAGEENSKILLSP